MKRLRLGRAWLATALLVPPAMADNLLKNPSFEVPKIEGRMTNKAGGNPAASEVETTWTQFQNFDRGGKVTVGLTNEIARTGKQSIYVDFAEAEKTKGAFLMSDLIPIKAEEKYRVSLWGRVDAKRPLTLDQGRPFQVLEVEFYPADQASRIGEAEVRAQMIPGMAERLLFISSKWTEYYAEFKAPPHAEFMKITFKWESPKRDGAASGIIYFDDAAVEGVPGTLVPSADPPEPTPEVTPGEGKAAPLVVPAPVAPPTK